MLFIYVASERFYGFLRTFLSVRSIVLFKSASFFGIWLMTLEFVIRWFICFFRVSGSGMPGVGVAPFGTGVLPTVFGSGMPGVGVVPFGRLFILTVLGSGMPGVELP